MNRKILLRDAFSGVKIKEALVRICHNDGGIIMVVNSSTQLQLSGESEWEGERKEEWTVHEWSC